ncbi:manganese catalase family protein [Caloranaerobacter sp. DY30410]|uniref:manganese catalase family protein n=1 Tax=Caloranaerobacter sp. DY30410 TaxID=3238305 RepID=UPI003D0187D8
MWIYEKKLQYPVRVDTCNPTLAAMILEQFGGPDGELSAGIRYLTQRWAMPTDQAKGILTDIGTEEFAPLCYQ